MFLPVRCRPCVMLILLEMLRNSWQMGWTEKCRSPDRVTWKRLFIRRLEPHWVVFSAAYHNPFGHPHQQVVDRYRELGSEAIYTGSAGAVSFILSPDRPLVPEWRWRDRARCFWHE